MNNILLILILKKCKNVEYNVIYSSYIYAREGHRAEFLPRGAKIPCKRQDAQRREEEEES